jgi:DNA-binding response OmpR family regulator
MSNLAAANDSPLPDDAAGEPVELQLGNVKVDLGTFKVSVGPRPESLTYQEFELLRYLAGFKDRVVPFEALSGFLWGTQGPKETRRLNVLVCRLRSKLRDSVPYRLETVRGRGYGLLSHFRGRPTQGREGGAS